MRPHLQVHTLFLTDSADSAFDIRLIVHSVSFEANLTGEKQTLQELTEGQSKSLLECPRLRMPESHLQLEQSLCAVVFTAPFAPFLRDTERKSPFWGSGDLIHGESVMRRLAHFPPAWPEWSFQRSQEPRLKSTMESFVKEVCQVRTPSTFFRVQNICTHPYSFALESRRRIFVLSNLA